MLAKGPAINPNPTDLSVPPGYLRGATAPAVKPVLAPRPNLSITTGPRQVPRTPIAPTITGNTWGNPQSAALGNPSNSARAAAIAALVRTGVQDPPKTQPNTSPKSRPTGSTGKKDPSLPPPPVGTTVQTPAQILAQLKALTAQLGVGGVRVPPALALTHIASLVNSIPTQAPVPGWDSLAAIHNALTPGKNTPGYVDPTSAANAAAQQAYGPAISSDQLNLAQTTAQNAQSEQDIQNWYTTLLGAEKTNAASDASGYQAAIQGTGNLGSVSDALGFDQGSAGADTIGQTGSILNAAARMAAASGAQQDRNLQSTSALGGVQDYTNQVNKDSSALQTIRGQLASDLKSKGSAYTTALDAAKQANTGNASAYAQALSGINSNYQNQFNTHSTALRSKVSDLTGLNNQFVTQSLNNTKTKIAALGTAAAIHAIPGQEATAAAGNQLTTAKAWNQFYTGQAALIKAKAARDKAAGIDPLGTSPLSHQSRSQLGSAILKTVYADSRAFKKDPTTGATTLTSRAAAFNDIRRMLAIAGIDPRDAGRGQILAGQLEGMIG